MLRGWLFSKGGQCPAPQRGLREKGSGHGLRCPLHRSREHSHVQTSAWEQMGFTFVGAVSERTSGGEEGGARREAGESKENFLYGSLASAKQEMPCQLGLFSGLQAVSAEEFPSPKQGDQKAPISVAQERQILDVPTLIPGPCTAAPKAPGAA